MEEAERKVAEFVFVLSSNLFYGSLFHQRPVLSFSETPKTVFHEFQMSQVHMLTQRSDRLFLQNFCLAVATSSRF